MIISQKPKAKSQKHEQPNLESRTSNLQTGFTIIELLVATTVFSAVLLTALGSFLRISQMFYKGIVIDRTRIAADQIMADIRAGFNSNSSYGSGPGYFCIGNTRYSYMLGNMVDLTKESSTNYGLVKDSPGGCPSPSAVPVNGPELLGNKMRLSQLDIKQVDQTAVPEAGNVYTISLKFAYGSDSVLSDPQTANPSCAGSLNISQFCTVNSLFSAVNLGQ